MIGLDCLPTLTENQGAAGSIPALGTILTPPIQVAMIQGQPVLGLRAYRISFR